ncbi:hypothetical protein [Brassicibacter mesophilus]|uniref:hypothetical protein n=1 Tax=Brassicibacter mesophilus TaxID=745119 RepID=UPI003D19A7FA
MIKYNLKSLLYAIFTGVIIAFFIDWISGNTFFEEPLSYVFSICIAVITSVLIELVYIKVLIRKYIPMYIKYISVYFITLLVYVIGNLWFRGFRIFAMPELYLFGILILVIITPMIYWLYKRMAQYDKFLELKKEKN